MVKMGVINELSALTLAIFFCFVRAQNSTNSDYDVLQYVDQLIGSSNGGETNFTVSKSRNAHIFRKYLPRSVNSLRYVKIHEIQNLKAYR